MSGVYDTVTMEDAMKVLYEVVKDGKPHSYSELSNCLTASFCINTNQISGLIHRLHAKKKFLKKIEGEYALYKIFIEPSFIEKRISELEQFLRNANSEFLTNVMSLSTEEIILAKKYIHNLENTLVILKNEHNANLKLA